MAARQSVCMLLAMALLAALIPVAGSGPASAAAKSTPVQVVFQGSGAETLDLGYQDQGMSCATHDEMALQWSVVFQTTIEDGVLQDAPGALAGYAGEGAPQNVGNVNFAIASGSCAQYLSGCQGALTVAAAEAPQLAVSGADPERVTAQSLPSRVNAPECLTGAATALVGVDLFILGKLLPDATTAVATIPKAKVAVGSVTKVSSAEAPGQAPRDCASLVGDPRVVSCAQDLKWSGTLTITCAASDQIATVTIAEGETSVTQGSAVCKGQTITTGKNGRVKLTFNDGGILFLGPNTEIDEVDEEKFQENTPTISDRFHLILGRAWWAIEQTIGHETDVCANGGCRGFTGVRGSEFTVSRGTPGGPLTVHVIAGQGFIRLADKPEVDFPAGYTAITDGATYTLTTDWPAADQALVPKNMRPPSLTNVSLSGSGAGLKVTLKLNASAALVVMVKQGDKTIATAKENGKKGTNSLAPLKADLPPGSYTVMVSATKSKRVSIAELPLVVPGLASPVASPIATPGG